MAGKLHFVGNSLAFYDPSAGAWCGLYKTVSSDSILLVVSGLFFSDLGTRICVVDSAGEAVALISSFLLLM
jgi:hypothetical protein